VEKKKEQSLPAYHQRTGKYLGAIKRHGLLHRQAAAASFSEPPPRCAKPVTAQLRCAAAAAKITAFCSLPARRQGANINRRINHARSISKMAQQL